MANKKGFWQFIKPMIIMLAALFLTEALELVLNLPARVHQISDKIGAVLLITGIAWALCIIVNLAKRKLLANYDFSQTDNLKVRKLYTQYGILEKIIIIIIITVAVANALMLFDSIRNIGISLFATAGIAGLILGLAAQKGLGTILAGLQLAITQPIRLDDVVIVENEWGWVEEIHLTYVVVRIWDKRRLVLPSTYFLEHPFQNWTRTSADILGTVFIYTDYTIPFNAIRQELTNILEDSKEWNRKVNVLQVTNAKEDTVEIRALMSADNSPEAWSLRVHVREKLIEYIQREHPHCLPKTRIIIEESGKKE